MVNKQSTFISAYDAALAGLAAMGYAHCDCAADCAQWQVVQRSEVLQHLGGFGFFNEPLRLEIIHEPDYCADARVRCNAALYLCDSCVRHFCLICDVYDLGPCTSPEMF